MKIAYIDEDVLVSKVTAPKIPFSKFMELCSYRPAGYQFSGKFQAGMWDGKIRLARVKNNTYTFPSGLLDSVRELLIDLGYKVKRKRLYTVKDIKKSNIAKLKTKTLRDYQKEAVSMALYHKRGVIKAPTGSGKSLIAAGIIKSIRREAIFLTHSRTILYQVAEVLRKELGRKFVGIVGDKLSERTQPVTVASIPTLYKNLKSYEELLNRKMVMIGDEVHHATSTSWYKVMNKIPSKYRLGLTATPAVGAHKLLLEAATGKVIYTVSPTKLIDEGYLAKPDIYMIDIAKDKLSYRLDYHAAYKEGITHYSYRNRTIANIAKFLSGFPELKPVVIQVRVLAHLRRIKKYLVRRKLKVRTLQGSDEAKRRSKFFSMVANDKLDVLLVSTVLDEGADLPNIRSLIIAPGGHSVIKTIQRLGRGMRPTKDKKKVLVVDFFDHTHDYLLKHSRKRRLTYKREKYDVTQVSYINFKKRIRD